MKWFGTALFLFGSIVISAFPALGTAWWPFVAFLFGHCLWTIAGLYMRDNALIALNSMYIPLDIYAIFIRIGMTS